MTEAVEVTVRDRTEKGWWVDQSHWYQQKLFSKTGVAEIVKLKDGSVTRGLLLYEYDGWFDCGYAPLTQLIAGEQLPMGWLLKGIGDNGSFDGFIHPILGIGFTP